MKRGSAAKNVDAKLSRRRKNFAKERKKDQCFAMYVTRSRLSSSWRMTKMIDTWVEKRLSVRERNLETLNINCIT